MADLYIKYIIHLRTCLQVIVVHGIKLVLVLRPASPFSNNLPSKGFVFQVSWEGLLGSVRGLIFILLCRQHTALWTWAVSTLLIPYVNGAWWCQPLGHSCWLMTCNCHVTRSNMSSFFAASSSQEILVTGSTKGQGKPLTQDKRMWGGKILCRSSWTAFHWKCICLYLFIEAIFFFLLI